MTLFTCNLELLLDRSKPKVVCMHNEPWHTHTHPHTHSIILNCYNKLLLLVNPDSPLALSSVCQSGQIKLKLLTITIMANNNQLLLLLYFFLFACGMQRCLPRAKQRQQLAKKKSENSCLLLFRVKLRAEARQVEASPGR